MKAYNRVFLGGTCSDFAWREQLIKQLNIDYFNPVVDDWNAPAQAREELEKDSICNIHFYLITSEMIGVYSIAEVVDSVHNKGKVTILHVMPDGFSESQLRSLSAVVGLVNRRGGIAYMDDDLKRSVEVLNSCFK